MRISDLFERACRVVGRRCGVVCAMGYGVLGYWLVESFVDSLWYGRPFMDAFFRPTSHEAWMRGSFIAVFLGYILLSRLFRKRVEEFDADSREHRLMLEHALGAAKAACWKYDPRTSQMSWTDEVLPLFGIAPEDDPQGLHGLLSTVHEDCLGEVLIAFDDLKDGAPREPFRFRVVHPGGGVRDIECSSSLSWDAEGGVSLIGLFQDITDRVRAEEELRAMSERAEEANRAKSEFLSKMSHEIRTPISGVLGICEVLQPKLTTPDQRHYVGMIERAGNSLLTIVNDILDLSKIDAKKLELREREFNLLLFLDQTAELFTVQAERKGLNFSFQADSVLPQLVHGDSDRLYQVLNNLLSNAVKFTESGRVSLFVSCSPKGGGVEAEFSVRDTGRGIDPLKAANLFKPFSQVEAKDPQEGAGLGLYISYSLVEMMGGAMWFESEPGVGTTFSFTLPLLGQAGDPCQREAEPLALPLEPAEPKQAPVVVAEEELQPEEAALPAPSDPASAPRPLQPASILVAEGNPVSCVLLGHLLEQAGHTVRMATSRGEAEQALNGGSHDLVIYGGGLGGNGVCDEEGRHVPLFNLGERNRSRGSLLRHMQEKQLLTRDNLATFARTLRDIYSH